jgi:aminoglycoside/choline kinase family phosphotransferase
VNTTPTKPEDISSQWLNEALQAGKAIPDTISVTGFDLEPMGEGVGMMSSMSRIRLNYSQQTAEAPQSLVIKFVAENETNRAVAETYNLYEREVRYYQQLADQTEARSPRIYSAYIDDESNFHLLMEDVSNYRMGDQVIGATAEECELCINELAKLHSPFWGRIEEIDWLPHMSNSQNATNLAKGAEIGWSQMMNIFGDWVPDSINSKRDVYLSGISRMQQALDVEPITIIHGDFRMDNMLFGDKPDHHPLLVVDFQGPLRGRGIHDVAYLLSHSAQTDARQAHESRLVQHYVDSLKSGGVEGYDFDMAWQDYRLGVLYCWTIAVVIAGTLDPSNERGLAWMSKMVERNCVAIEDLNCLDLL